MARTIFLSGFPTIESDFFDWWDRRDEGDYLAAQFPDRRFNGPKEAWDHFSQSARKLEEAFESVENLGGCVNRKATISDLSSSFDSFDTVILLAHWRHTAYLDHHLLDCEGAARRIRQLFDQTANNEATAGFSKILVDHPNPLKSNDRRDVIDCLDWLVSMYAKFSAGGASNNHHNSETLRLANARRELDRLLLPFVSSGNQLELWDGLTDPILWDANELSEKISLDLLVCRSYELAVNLKRSLGGKVSIISGRLPVSIVPRALIAAKALALSIEHECEYSEAAISLREITSQEWKGKFTWA